MNKETLKLDQVEVNKKKFHLSKEPIALHLVNVNTKLTLTWVCLVEGGGNFTPTPAWFSLNNSEKVKAVTPAFCIIQ